MAFDAFLNFDGIKGESQDDKHKDWIEIQSFNWELTQPATGPGGGGGTSAKPSITEITVTKKIDVASPQLMRSCATGQHIKTAILSCRTSDTNQDFLKITFQNILISGFVQGGHAGSEQETAPTEQISLNFSKLQLSYTPASPDGTIVAPIIADADVLSGG